MADSHFMPLGDDGHEDLPRTFRREKEARAREARERAEQERASAPPTLDTPPQSERSAAAFGPAPADYSADVAEPYEGIAEMPYPAAVRRFDVPFFHLMAFFIKAVFAAVPALMILGIMLWFGGQLLEVIFPDLIKMKILISFPN